MYKNKLNIVYIFNIGCAVYDICVKKREKSPNIHRTKCFNYYQ